MPAGDASLLGHPMQTSDASTLQHSFAPFPVGDAPDALQAGGATASQPGTLLADCRQGRSRSPSPERLRRTRPWTWEMEAPPAMPTAAPNYLDQHSRLGCDDSHQQPATDHQPRSNILRDRFGPTLDHILYLDPAPRKSASWRTNPPSQESHSSARGRSPDNSVGNSTHITLQVATRQVGRADSACSRGLAAQAVVA